MDSASSTSKVKALPIPPPVKIPDSMLAVQVVRREEVTKDVATFYLAQPNTQLPPKPSIAGQFVTLAIPTPTETLYRSYSLCGVGMPREPWEITVKRVPDGRVSNYLLDSVPVDALLYASEPRGTFVLPMPLRPDVPLVFIAVGSGITPIRGMLRALAMLPPHRRPMAQLHYASRSPEDVIFRKDWETIDPRRSWLRQWHYLSSQGNRLTADKPVMLAGRLARWAHWYYCGPDSLREDLQAQLTAIGVPPAQFHSEAFATQKRPKGKTFSMAAAGEQGAAGGFQLFIQETNATLNVQPEETLLEALERQGYEPNFSCRNGNCGACKLRLLSGRCEQKEAVALSAKEKAEGYVLSCVAHAQSDVTLLSGGTPPTIKNEKIAMPAARGGKGGKGGKRESIKMLIRAGCVAAVIALAAGLWQLTDHSPFASAAGPTPVITQPVGTPSPIPTDPNAPQPQTGDPTQTTQTTQPDPASTSSTSTQPPTAPVTTGP